MTPVLSISMMDASNGHPSNHNSGESPLEATLTSRTLRVMLCVSGLAYPV
jgi:hypothetical protein